MYELFMFSSKANLKISVLMKHYGSKMIYSSSILDRRLILVIWIPILKRIQIMISLVYWVILKKRNLQKTYKGFMIFCQLVNNFFFKSPKLSFNFMATIGCDRPCFDFSIFISSRVGTDVRFSQISGRIPDIEITRPLIQYCRIFSLTY